MTHVGTMLGIWAHPDDETYLTAGLMAHSVAEGSRVVCVTATRGEEGSMDEEKWPPETMGAVREQEMMRSLAALGVREHHWLDYHDGTLAGVAPAEGIARARAFIRDVAPDSVFTFGPDGMTGHPDHKAVSSWTTQAFREAAGPEARLYYATQTPDWAERFVPRMNQFNVFMEPGTPPVTPRDQLGLLFALPPDILELKVKAVEAHESQVEGMRTVLGDDFIRESQAEEYFVLAGIGPGLSAPVQDGGSNPA
ncbi:MAG TPA: PIG-L family deacetylase [Actinomycetota bacterium]|jgi:LmbE family N-acetylglucosaminyl deacetylase